MFFLRYLLLMRLLGLAHGELGVLQVVVAQMTLVVPMVTRGTAVLRPMVLR